MGLTFAARVDSRGFDVELELADGERLAVLGPNGAGKSTLLSILAGTLRPDQGRAALDGAVLFDVGRSRTGRGRSRWLAPHSRRVALLAQDPLLFPHLSVRDNVAFGPRATGEPRASAGRIADHWLAEVEADRLADHRPGQLSGGQAQRVAVARAVATDPRLLLLDEPLAALDITAAPLLRRVLRAVLADRTAVTVTHDLLDAVLLSDRVLVLDQGHVVESGPTARVLRHPTTPFTARLAGLNLVTGRTRSADPAQLQPGRGGPLVDGIARAPLVAGDPATAVFSPTAISVHTVEPHGSPRNLFAVTITELEPRGDHVRLRAVTGSGELLSADVTTAAVGELDLDPGRPAWYAVKATAVSIHPS